MGLLLFGITLIIFVFIKCSKDYAVRDNDEAKGILSNYYPKNIEKDYNLIVRYESKNDPSTWESFQWKKDNNLLEKKGLLKQIITDTITSFYNHSLANFENKHQFFYKVILSSKINTLIIEPQLRIKKLDEYDNFNKGTGRITSLNCKAVCGLLVLDKIVSIQQSNSPYTTEIQYYEKFSPTPFNEIINYDHKYYDGEMTLNKVTAKRFKNSKLKLIN